MKVLIVSNNTCTQTIISRAFERAGLAAVPCEGEKTVVWRGLVESLSDLVVCDWELADEKGLELCRRVRSTKMKAPYLILLGGDDPLPSDADAAFQAGADEFLPKPLHFHALVTRLRAIVRFLVRTGGKLSAQRILSMCAYCKATRDDQHDWRPIEALLEDELGLKCSHGFCPDCYRIHTVP